MRVASPISSRRAWLMASRPRTLTAAVMPVVVGAALAVRLGTFRPLAALAALLAAVLIQVGTNLANDYYDYKKGADTSARVGPIRVTSAGLLSPNAVRNGMWLSFGLAALCGLYLIGVAGWPVLAIGLASMVAGIAYTAGPFPLGYNGLGDLFVFVFFGLVAVVGTVYVQVLDIVPAAVVAAVPIGALATNIIVVNNVRDADTDRVAGKRTLAVLLGKDAARAEYALLAAVAYLLPFVLWLCFAMSIAVLLPLLTLPRAVALTRALYTDEGPALNRALGGTAQLHTFYGLLLAVGLLF